MHFAGKSLSYLSYVIQTLVLELNFCGGGDSVFSIATRYGLDGPGIESRWS